MYIHYIHIYIYMYAYIMNVYISSSLSSGCPKHSRPSQLCVGSIISRDICVGSSISRDMCRDTHSQELKTSKLKIDTLLKRSRCRGVGERRQRIRHDTSNRLIEALSSGSY